MGHLLYCLLVRVLEWHEFLNVQNLNQTRDAIIRRKIKVFLRKQFGDVEHQFDDFNEQVFVFLWVALLVNETNLVEKVDHVVVDVEFLHLLDDLLVGGEVLEELDGPHNELNVVLVE